VELQAERAVCCWVTVEADFMESEPDDNGPSPCGLVMMIRESVSL
jgi:hypothetical protein